MTAKQKAEEIIRKYYTFGINKEGQTLSWLEAKQCALIAVDEILEELVFRDFANRFPYWMEVKEQINKEKYDNIDESTEIVTSKTEEIFDKEQWAAALKLTSNIQEHNGWEKAIKWYREQLKKK